ncbi:TPA: ead/Ea22-like family protein [Klebsiella pneumoniae]
MTTDITELAQSLKAAAEKVTALNLDTAQEVRDEDGYLECPVCGGEGSVDSERDYCNIDGVALGIQFYGIGEHHGLAEQYFRIATPSNILSLIEVLEKAHTINAAAEKLVRCKVRYHSELNYRALAALFGVNIPDLPPLEHENVHYADAAEMEIAALRQRIAELESRTVTFKLPSTPEPSAFAPWVAKAFYQFHRDTVKSCFAVFSDACAVAGIKVEAE